MDYDDIGARKKLSRLRPDICPDDRQSHFHRQNDEDKTFRQIQGFFRKQKNHDNQLTYPSHSMPATLVGICLPYSDRVKGCQQGCIHNKSIDIFHPECFLAFCLWTCGLHEFSIVT